MKKRGLLIGAGAAGALALAAAFANSSAPTASANETAAPAAAAPAELQQVAMTGHPVTLTYGPGISPAAVEGAVGVVRDRGCPASAIGDGFPESVEVETNGKSAVFDDPADAAGWALDHCK